MAHARTTSNTSLAAREAIIGSSTRIQGRVTGDGDLIIAGQVEGDILLRGGLTIAEGGSVTSNVEALSVNIAGALEGDIISSGTLRLSAAARVRGNMRVASISIEDGAQFNGRIDCDFDMPSELGDENDDGGEDAEGDENDSEDQDES